MGHARRDRGRVTPANALVVIKWNGSRVGNPSAISRIRLDTDKFFGRNRGDEARTKESPTSRSAHRNPNASAADQHRHRKSAPYFSTGPNTRIPPPPRTSPVL